MTTSGLLSANDIRRLLDALAAELSLRRVKARIFIVGGAAMALAYYDRAATRDVDAIFAPADVVAEAADVVGRREGVADGWLNDAAKLFVPEHVEMGAGRPVVVQGDIAITVAPADLLLAMKMRASRGRRDIEDMAVLLRQLQIDSAAAARDVYDSYFPEDPPPSRAEAALAEAIERARRRGPS